ncbi:MAG: DUF4265 domain-containing protein [Anaeromyxobacter sp.]
MTTELQTTEGLVRIRVPLDRGTDEGGPAEDWLWGEPLGSGRYRIESSAFFAYGISRDDIVGATEEGGATPLLDEVLEKGGHRTLRVALDDGIDLRAAPMQKLLERLIEMGCTHEVLRPKIVAIDLPPEVDVQAIAALLQSLAEGGHLIWEWADPRPS